MKLVVIYGQIFRKLFTKYLTHKGYKCKNKMTQPYIMINTKDKGFFCVHQSNMHLFIKQSW